ncbi:hypothetical protein [Halorhabdus rudnickae]|uniref:hypothetical protein n=1 Tax=Halorhabdus rudnickae TaxID=1775544 RepID=UPI001082EB7C|nr:hypothetical protein [Halorhabdus rudnickae]
MECPRCGKDLATFAIEGTEATAVVCESCGFSGVPASHRHEDSETETWDRAMKRFESEQLPPEATCLIGREDGVSIPNDGSDSETGSGTTMAELGTVTVAASLDTNSKKDA